MEWSLQDAKNRFSALVNAALTGEPQRVTRRGQPAVVVLAEEEYERLCRLEEAAGPTLGELLARIPQDDGEFERLPFRGRPAKTLQMVMDEMSRAAESRGLTPEVLEDILSEE